MNLTSWIAPTISAIENWGKPKVAKVTAFLSPFLKDIEKTFLDDILPIAEKDVIAIVQNGLPIALAALSGNPLGNLPIALIKAEEYIVPALRAEGIVLFQTSINVLTNMLVAKGQIELAKAAPVVVEVPVITPIPS